MIFRWKLIQTEICFGEMVFKNGQKTFFVQSERTLPLFLFEYLCNVQTSSSCVVLLTVDGVVVVVCFFFWKIGLVHFLK